MTIKDGLVPPGERGCHLPVGGHVSARLAAVFQSLQGSQVRGHFCSLGQMTISLGVACGLGVIGIYGVRGEEASSTSRKPRSARGANCRSDER